MTTLETTKAILRDLIAFPSISSASNLGIIDYIRDHLERAAAVSETQKSPCGQKANLLARIGPEIDGGILLSGHSDVVPVTDQNWSADPFSMIERDERLYGRGACDMKGFIAACLALAPHYATLNLKQPIYFAFTYDEEVGCIGAKALANILRERKVKPSMAIIGEPTNMRPVDGHKGICECTTRFRGLEGHGSAPDLGVNAVEYAVRFVNGLFDLREKLKSRAPASSPFDPPWTSVNTGALHGGVAHNVIAPSAEVEWEFRPVNTDDLSFVNNYIIQLIDAKLLPEMREIHPASTIEHQIIGSVEGLNMREENQARDLLFELTGANRASTVAFGTEAGIFQSLGIDVVVCGPGSITEAHKADEFVSIEQIEKCLVLLNAIAERMINP